MSSYTFRVCVCTLSYLACKGYAQSYTIFLTGLPPTCFFQNYLKNDKICPGGGGIIDPNTCDFIFPTNFQTLLTLSRIQRNVTIGLHQSSCKVPVILFRYGSKFNNLYKFSKTFMKIRPLGKGWVAQSV